MKTIDYSVHYNQYEQDYEKTTYHYEELFETHLKGLNINSEILDIGCTNGKSVYSLNKLGFINVLGIDIPISKKLLEIGIANNLNLKLVDSLISFLETNYDKFHVILLFDVLEHIDKHEQIELLTKIYKALKTDGKLIIQVPNAESIVSSKMRYIDFTHTISYTEDSLKFLLNSSGFKKFKFFEARYNFRFKNLFKKLFTLSIKTSLRFCFKILLYSELSFSEIKKIKLSPNIITVVTK
jgi:2-polyprenyl-3-methyl-5-hydroxy-6-metoxy-1,4-benzoquinol methylase